MKKKILIVEDDEAIIDSIQLLLEMEGYEFKSITDGRKVRRLKEPLPDLILLDIWMSGQDGREISKYLKSNQDTKHIPVIFISASKDLEKSASLAGADDYLAKPFEMDDLLKKIKNFLSPTE